MKAAALLIFLALGYITLRPAAADPPEPRGLPEVSAYARGVVAQRERGGVLALLLASRMRPGHGMVALYRASDRLLLGAVPIGALPASLEFSADGRGLVLSGGAAAASGARIVDIGDPARPRMQVDLAPQARSVTPPG